MVRLKIPQWVGRLGLFIASVGNWMAGHRWRVNLYEEGIRHALLYPEDCREYLRDNGHNSKE